MTIDSSVPPTWLLEENKHTEAAAVPARTAKTATSTFNPNQIFLGARTTEEEIRTRGKEEKKRNSPRRAAKEEEAWGREGFVEEEGDSLDHRTAPHAFISVTRL